MTFDIIVLGHLTHDIVITPDRIAHRALGGVATYTSLAAARLGATVGIVTKVGADFMEDYLDYLRGAGIDLSGLRVRAGKTTTFENAYDESGRRTQRILSSAGVIEVKDVPGAYFDAKCFHFGPVFHEVSRDLIRLAHEGGILTSLDPQGYCRERGADNVISLRRWRGAEEALPYVDILKCDEDEAAKIAGVSDLGKAAELISGLGPRIVLITRGRRGSVLYYKGKLKRIPTVPEERFVDSTGAGDAYAAGFIVEYLRTGKPELSAFFASCVASFVVEGIGATTLPTRDMVMRRLRAFLGEA